MTTQTNHTFLEGPYRYSDRPRPQLLAPLSRVLLSSALAAAVLASLALIIG